MILDLILVLIGLFVDTADSEMKIGQHIEKVEN